MEQIAAIKLTHIESDNTPYEKLTLAERYDYWNAYLYRLTEFTHNASCYSHNHEDLIEEEICKIKKILLVLQNEPRTHTRTSDFSRNSIDEPLPYSTSIDFKAPKRK